ncbi:MAG: TadE family protein [Acidobacteriaceae bacterium]
MKKRFARRLSFRLPHRARYRAPVALQKRGHGRGEEGAAMVEMAISIVILLTIVLGIMKVCLALYTYHYISEAAREGTRFAIVRGSACASPGYECDATSAQIKTYVEGLGYPGIDPSVMTVTSAWSGYPVSGTCVSAGCNGPGDLVTVIVGYKFPLSIPFVPSQTISMSSSSAMVISQ